MLWNNWFVHKKGVGSYLFYWLNSIFWIGLKHFFYQILSFLTKTHIFTCSNIRRQIDDFECLIKLNEVKNIGVKLIEWIKTERIQSCEHCKETNAKCPYINLKVVIIFSDFDWVVYFRCNEHVSATKRIPFHIFLFFLKLQRHSEISNFDLHWITFIPSNENIFQAQITMNNSNLMHILNSI